MHRLSVKSLVLLGVLGLVACYCLADWYVALPADATASYVGRASCVDCHQQEAKLYEGSHHDHAMEPATPETVRGDFADVTFERLGVVTKFFRKGDEFWVNTEGPHGDFRDYRVAYTFGYEPLQQYLIELEGGRLQTLRVSWDTEQKKWFEVPPPDATEERLAPDDPLHWTGFAQNWNTMCAECHSTDLRKNYDLKSDTYKTTWNEIDVSCEACHGPGSLHVELANARSLFWDRRHGYGLARLKAKENDAQVQACMPCHSRRGAIQGGWRAGENYHDYYELSLLEPGLYHADGQILDEVYVSGSFLQSRMYHENVKCSDCHDPHSLKLKYAGNLLCTQCHQNYDTKKHHFHDVAKEGGAEATQCVNCHMPKRYYMVNDGRRDHSFRIPRPDLSVDLGTPNACNDCHTKPGEDAAWAAEAVRKWYGPKRPNDPHWAPALAAAWNGDSDGVAKIAELLHRPPPPEPGRRTPDILRATALRTLVGYQTPESDALCLKALADPSPLVRAAAIRSLTPQGVAEHAREVAGGLRDERLLVRAAAADALALRAPGQLTRAEDRQALQQALREVEEGQRVMADRAGPHLRLAELAGNRGKLDDATQSLRNAIQVEPFLAGPRGELARLLEQQGGEADEVRSLRSKEVELLRRDTQLLEGEAGPHYQLGLLLYLLGNGDEAVAALEEACRLSPDSFDYLTALALLYEQQQRWADAAKTLKRMNALRPNDPAVTGILERIQQTRSQQRGPD